MPRAACLKAIGIVNCLGSGAELVRERLWRGDQSFLAQRSNLIPGKKVWVGEVRDPLPEIPHKYWKQASRNLSLLLEAYRQIEPAVQQYCTRFGSQRVGIVLGSSTSGIAEGEKALRHHLTEQALPDSYHVSQQEPGIIAPFLADFAGITGPAYTVSTACSSSAKVFRSARALLDLHVCDAVIVGGVDSLCELTLNGFNALELLSDNICNPMSINRSGITIGEAACIFLLTRDPEGVQLLGIGESSDAYHISAPEPEGRGAEIAMRAALQDAELTPHDINYINLHGTGTIHNDSMEAKAIARIFPGELPCSSTKPLIGHTLGAAGATELGFCWLSLTSEGSQIPLPPHRWDEEPDPQISALTLVKEHKVQKKNSELITMLSNSFAFGGSNCSLIVGYRSHI